MRDEFTAVRRLLNVHLAAVVAAIVTVAVLYVATVRSIWLVAVAGVLAGAGVCLVVARRAADRRQDMRMVVLVSLASWSVAVGLTTITTWAVHVTPLGLLLPVVLAVPFLDRQRLAVMVTSTVVLAVVVTLLARLRDGSRVEEFVPERQRTAVLMLFVPITVGLVALQAWHNHAGLARQAVELQASRRRLVTATDEVRRRLERDLHDGTQQRLVAVAVQLRVAERLITERPDAAVALVNRLVVELQETSHELRDLSHGIYPPELTHHGLDRALDVLASRSPRPTSVAVVGVGRYRADVEATVYFCCVEAIQNVVKHAGEEVRIRISVDGRGPLTFDIDDDGAGFDPGTSDGHGVVNMVDRVGALGGTLTVRSTPGHGTRVHATIPAPPPADAPPPTSSAHPPAEPSPRSRTSPLRRELLPTAAAGAFALAVAAAVNAWVIPGRAMFLVVVVTAVIFCLPCVVAVALADRRPRVAIVLFTAAYWTFGLLLTALIPWTLFITPLIVLLPVVLTIPHAGRDTFAWMIAGVMTVAVVLTVLGRTQDGVNVEDDSPSWLSSSLLTVCVPMAVCLIALQAWHNHAELARQAVELQASRRRLVTATDEVRRRLERDLHDGTQQRLVAVAVQLRVAERLITERPDAAVALVNRLVVELQETSHELRDLSHGIYPPELTHHGLDRALDVLASRSPRPTSVAVVGVGRYRADVEATVYFCCVEAIQNVVKHAGEAARIRISVDGRGPLTFDIDDDGAGFDPGTSDGHGVVNMVDRVGALGGTLTVRSTPGHGTRVHATIPAPPPADAPPPTSATHPFETVGSR